MNRDEEGIFFGKAYGGAFLNSEGNVSEFTEAFVEYV